MATQDTPAQRRTHLVAVVGLVVAREDREGLAARAPALVEGGHQHAQRGARLREVAHVVLDARVLPVQVPVHVLAVALLRDGQGHDARRLVG